MLKSMTVTASEYECPVFFKPACLSSGALSTALRSLSTTMTDTMTTLAETHKSDREYREFVKMPLSEVGSSTVTDTWEVMKLQTAHYTANMRVRGGWTIVKTQWTEDGWTTSSNVLQNCNADGLAFETRWFGEGKERLVKEMREVCTSTGHFVGPSLVAKASILDEDKEGKGKMFHKRFLKTQMKSQQLAQFFNEALERVPGVDKRTPRIEFLSCWVFMIKTKEGRKGFLVEPMLDVKKFAYQKFNDNAGSLNIPQSGTLSTIQEGSEDEEGECEDGCEGISSWSDGFFSNIDIPQAFSCFSYMVSKRRLLVCDLQGIFNSEMKPPMFQLTDPAIHSNGTDLVQGSKAERYGRTDRRKEGIDDFFKTHTCSDCVVCCADDISNQVGMMQSGQFKRRGGSLISLSQS